MVVREFPLARSLSSFKTGLTPNQLVFKLDEDMPSGFSWLQVSKTLTFPFFPKNY